MGQVDIGNKTQIFDYLHRISTTKEVAKDMLMKENSLEEVVVRDEKCERTEFAITLIEDKILSTLKKFLSSAIFHDIGPVTARRIVSFFGLRTPQVIESELHEVLQVQGVGKKRMIALQNGWSYQKRVIIESEELIKLRSIHRDAL